MQKQCICETIDQLFTLALQSHFLRNETSLYMQKVPIKPLLFVLANAISNTFLCGKKYHASATTLQTLVIYLSHSLSFSCAYYDENKKHDSVGRLQVAMAQIERNMMYTAYHLPCDLNRTGNFPGALKIINHQ